MGSAQTSAMFLPPSSLAPRVTDTETGLSRVPLQVGHGTSRMKPSKRSRLVSVSASLWRRSM